MSTLINKILPKYLKKIDHNLLINYPLLWSSKILHVLWIAIIVLSINLLLSWVYPLEFFNIPNRTIFFFYSCFYSSALFITWLFLQQLFDFQLIHKGKRTYHFKGLMLFYSITIIIFLSAFIPYNFFNARINNFISDPNLPVLLENDYYFSRLNRRTNTNGAFEPAFLYDSLTATNIVIKELHKYRNRKIKKLSDPAIAYLMIQQYYNDIEDFNIKYNDINSTIYFDGRRQNTIQATSAVSHNATSNLIVQPLSIGLHTQPLVAQLRCLTL